LHKLSIGHLVQTVLQNVNKLPAQTGHNSTRPDG